MVVAIMKNYRRFNIFCLVIVQTSQISVEYYGTTVYPIDSCPKNVPEIENASKRLNCSKIDMHRDIYHCLPSSNMYQLVELCYKINIFVEKGNCLVFESGSLYNKSCHNFNEGCPRTSYDSKLMFKYPACSEINIKRKCYVEDPSCGKVHGGWSEYGPYKGWSNCTVTCGGGIEENIRIRFCNNPVPKHGGNNCVGSNKDKKERKCNPQSCSVDGQWSSFVPYGDWSQCSSSCNSGNKSRVRIRTCSDGKECVGQKISKEIMPCNTQPCNGNKDITQVTTMLIAIVPSTLFILVVVIVLYCHCKRRIRSEPALQSESAIYEEVNDMDIPNHTYVSSYAEYVPNQKSKNIPCKGNEVSFLLTKTQKVESTRCNYNNKDQQSKFGMQGNYEEIDEESMIRLKNDSSPCKVDAFNLADTSQVTYENTNKTMKDLIGTNASTEGLYVKGCEKPMMRKMNSYINVLRNETENLADDTIGGQQDYLDCSFGSNHKVKQMIYKFEIGKGYKKES